MTTSSSENGNKKEELIKYELERQQSLPSQLSKQEKKGTEILLANKRLEFWRKNLERRASVVDWEENYHREQKSILFLTLFVPLPEQERRKELLL
jgi:hypothetical protein